MLLLLREWLCNLLLVVDCSMETDQGEEKKDIRMSVIAGMDPDDDKKQVCVSCVLSMSGWLLLLLSVLVCEGYGC